MEKTALFYFHDYRCKDVCAYTFKRRGFSVKVVGSIEDALAELKQEKYTWCLMDDSNVKSLEDLDLTEAHKVHNTLKDKIKNGETEFLFLSYFQEAVDKAKAEGLSSMEKSEFDSRADELVGKKSL